MKTGEGKTLVATLAVALNAIAKKGVHVITVNDYLAARDAEWMGPVYRGMGLSVGVISPFMPEEERAAAYRCDITYGTNSEFGFDYLRDNMAIQKEQQVQRGHFFCIVDEVDSILIDEARTPLIISGPSEDDTEPYRVADDDELRSFLMPVNQTYPVAELRRAMQEYQEATGDRVTIEYALFGGVNDSVERARELVRFLKGIHVFVNLIPFNAVDGRYERPKAEDVLRFRSILQTAGFETEIRSEQGADIDAACGQLRRKTLGGAAAPLEAPSYSLTKADMSAERKPAKRPERAEKPAASGRAKTPRRETAAKTAAQPSGGFIASRGKRGRGGQDTQERYRSGKMKEARPSYRGQGGDEETPRPDRRDNRPARELPPKTDAFPKKAADGKRRGDKKELRGPAGKGAAGKKRTANKKADAQQGAFSKFYGASGKSKRSKKS